MSAIFALAAQQYKIVRADYEIVKENAYRTALEACNGVLLNARGKAGQVDPFSLFQGPEVRAHAYASEELLEHWYRHPRITFTAYERQMLELPE